MFYNISGLADAIYNAAADMDRNDYDENHDETLACLEDALSEINLLSEHGNRSTCESFQVLLSVLSSAFNVE